jgi:hypothetical protein
MRVSRFLSSSTLSVTVSKSFSCLFVFLGITSGLVARRGPCLLTSSALGMILLRGAFRSYLLLRHSVWSSREVRLLPLCPLRHLSCSTGEVRFWPICLFGTRFVLEAMRGSCLFIFSGHRCVLLSNCFSCLCLFRHTVSCDGEWRSCKFSSSALFLIWW